MARLRFISLMLALITLLVCLPVWQHSSASYDDPVYVTGNRMIQARMTWAEVKQVLTLDVQPFGTGPT